MAHHRKKKKRQLSFMIGEVLNNYYIKAVLNMIGFPDM